MNDFDALKKEGFLLMEKAGFPVGNVAVVLDDNLPYMGHTTEVDGMPVVVVSGMAFASGMAINLLVHELSHVYRTQSLHPSHDAKLIFSILTWVMHGKAVHPYQEDALFSINNHLQDLYADDIFFKVFDKDNAVENINEFFLDWVHEPVKKVKSREDSWTNASFMLSAAFAQANLYRHNIKDKRGEMEKAVSDYLQRIDRRQAERYEYFKNFMVALPEKVTEKEYEKLLTTYFAEFIRIANLV